ncbi:MAG: CoA pyrophosphatase [Deltaproteobacteria bacterium]|nr:CoA pyrophosphatase [Deltaproteobacteria bacterium]
MSTATPASFDDDVLDAIRARLAAISVRRMAGEIPRAAVLVPLCHVDGTASVLLTKRTETVGTHKGHVSFPGGRRDPTDVDVNDTALRELEEEVGIPRDRVQVLGLLHEIPAITGMGVTPVVGYVGDVDVGALEISTAEIAVAFAVPIASLVDPEHRRAQQLGPRVAPVFSAGLFPVWGLTAYILDELLREGLGLPLPHLGASTDWGIDFQK